MEFISCGATLAAAIFAAVGIWKSHQQLRRMNAIHTSDLLLRWESRFSSHEMQTAIVILSWVTRVIIDASQKCPRHVSMQEYPLYDRVQISRISPAIDMARRTVKSFFMEVLLLHEKNLIEDSETKMLLNTHCSFLLTGIIPALEVHVNPRWDEDRFERLIALLSRYHIHEEMDFNIKEDPPYELHLTFDYKLSGCNRTLHADYAREPYRML